LADVKNFNPYKLLGVSRSADLAEIDEAYNLLFDEYEPQAYAGDTKATQMLEELNRARDVLVDPEQRAALDARLGRAASQTRAAGYAGRESARTQAAPQTGSRAGADKRPRSVERQVQRSPVPWVLGGAVALVLVGVVVFLISRNMSNAQGGDLGAVVATVNSQPIYERELNARYETDKEQNLSDPLMQNVLTQGGETLSRALDVIKQDALDKLINMEVIQQEARAENLYPSPATQVELITQAKAVDVRPGQSFEDSLREHGLTEEQYNQNVIRDAVYRVMASKYMPATGDEGSRQSAFISWICQTRGKYDVQVKITFANATGNQPCSSGLPSNIQLTGDQLPPAPVDEPPFPEPTSTGPMVPRATP
jgi:hypothetical protein